MSAPDCTCFVWRGVDPADPCPIHGYLRRGYRLPLPDGAGCDALRADGAAAERAAVVAWLRATPGEPGLPWVDAANDIADAIEAGAHREGKP